MALRRKRKVLVHMEEVIFQAAKKVIEAEQLSDSAYVRRAVIEDLIKRGLLTHEMVSSLSI